MITIGITTYNRPRVLKMMAKSFYAADIKIPYNIRIYDDASTEYGVEFLNEIFPDAKTIVRQKSNIGADENIRFMYEDFLKYDDQYFFNADSDLIFSKRCIDNALNYFHKTDGILSLFNTPNHPTIKEDGVLSIKDSLGSAGTIFTRDCLFDFIEEIKKERCGKNLDWRWSKYFKGKGYRLFSMTNSLVQHIGVDGYNSSIYNMDYGYGFRVDSLENGQILNDVMQFITDKRETPLERKWYALFPFSEVPQNSKVVIYGAGIIGQDYKRQIQSTGYCQYVGMVDRSYYKFDDVNDPKNLKKMDFDYIILATFWDEVINSMKSDIDKIDNNMKRKVIDSVERTIRL